MQQKKLQTPTFITLHEKKKRWKKVELCLDRSDLLKKKKLNFICYYKKIYFKFWSDFFKNLV